MLLEAKIEEKQAGAKLLIHHADLQIQAGEVVGFVGRNGVGKTTLTRILTGEDAEFIGQVRRKAGLIILTTEQEQSVGSQQTTLEYVLSGLRDYEELTHIIETHPDLMGSDMRKIEEYTNALETYDERGYYHVRDHVVEALKAYQLTEAQISGPFEQLSGGEKRFAQLVQVEFSNADLLILDEPTNHMDYVAKAKFTEWLKSTQSAVLVISHDRDVLAGVDRIIELKDRKLFNFPGNYDAYLKQNAVSSTSAMHQYEIDIKTLDNRREALKQAEQKKLRSKQSPNPFVPLVRRLQREIAELEERIAKPTIWIDQASVQDLKRGQSEQYEKYKARSISLRGAHEANAGHTSRLVSVEQLSLGYGQPLFAEVSFELRAGERVQIVGRNGAGKTTLVDALCASAAGQKLATRIFGGLIDCAQGLKIGRYEQEIDTSYLTMTLEEAIIDIYRAAGRQVNEEVVYKVLAEYLFEASDRAVPVKQLSGGQKARIQLIALFAARPNLLILDEPTNHLDLPSIEELEAALARYDGAVLYISHDSYFAKRLGGQVIAIGAS